MTRIRYTWVATDKRLTVADLSEVTDHLVRLQAEQRLKAWSQSVRTQALLHIVEQRAGESVALQTQVCYTPCGDKT